MCVCVCVWFILLLLCFSYFFSSDYCLSFASTWLRSSYFKLYPFTYSILHFNFTYIFAIFASFIFFFFSFIVFNVSPTATIIGKCNEALETATSSSMPSIYFLTWTAFFLNWQIFLLWHKCLLCLKEFSKPMKCMLKLLTGSFHIWKQLYMTSHNAHIQNGRWNRFISKISKKRRFALCRYHSQSNLQFNESSSRSQSFSQSSMPSTSIYAFRYPSFNNSPPQRTTLKKFPSYNCSFYLCRPSAGVLLSFPECTPAFSSLTYVGIKIRAALVNAPFRWYSYGAFLGAYNERSRGRRRRFEFV